MSMQTRRNPFLLLPFIVLFSVACMCGLGSAPEAGAPAPQATQPAAEEAPAAVEVAGTPTLSVVFNVVGDPPQPAIPEQRLLTLEFPPQIRAGDSDVIRLTLEIDEAGMLTPTAQIDGNVVTGQTIEIPNLYETHHVTAEARLDLAGLEVRPPGVISEPLLAGESVTFFWSVRPAETGVYRGTVWLHLRFVDKVSGEESRKAVSAQTVELEAVDFFGLSANFARATGAVGTLVGGVLGLPFIGDILKFIFRRRKK
jgi:hypothetical protein